MVLSLLPLLFLGAVVVDAAAIASSSPQSLEVRNITELDIAVLPFGKANTTARAEAIEVKREGWDYGPSKLGNNSYYPNGTLGDARSMSDQALFLVIQEAIEGIVEGDLETAEVALVSLCSDLYKKKYHRI